MTLGVGREDTEVEIYSRADRKFAGDRRRKANVDRQKLSFHLQVSGKNLPTRPAAKGHGPWLLC